jgi:hypothetical protein
MQRIVWHYSLNPTLAKQCLGVTICLRREALPRKLSLQETLSLHGKFWHCCETVLGRAAMWLNECMPEIVSVKVEELDELQDFE